MQQLDVFLLQRAALEKALKAREGLFWLFMVYFPQDRYDYALTATRTATRTATKAQWDAAVKDAERIEEIRGTLKWIGR